MGTMIDAVRAQITAELQALAECEVSSWEEYEKLYWKPPTPIMVHKRKREDVMTTPSSSATKPH